MDALIGPVVFAQKLENWGLDSFWVADSPTSKELDPMSTLAAVGQVTTTIQLGPSVVALPFTTQFSWRSKA